MAPIRSAAVHATVHRTVKQPMGRRLYSENARIARRLASWSQEVEVKLGAPEVTAEQSFLSRLAYAELRDKARAAAASLKQSSNDIMAAPLLRKRSSSFAKRAMDILEMAPTLLKRRSSSFTVQLEKPAIRVHRRPQHHSSKSHPTRHVTHAQAAHCLVSPDTPTRPKRSGNYGHHERAPTTRRHGCPSARHQGTLLSVASQSHNLTRVRRLPSARPLNRDKGWV